MAPGRSLFSTPGAVLLFAVLLAYLYGPNLRRTDLVLGLFRKPANTVLASTSDFTLIDKTTHCEDIHYHEPSKLLFTACEDVESTRHSWFPPLAIFDDPSAATQSQGSVKIIDPTTLRAEALRFENFKKPFVTHGIDVIDDPDRQRGEAVYVFAVSHVPNRDHYEKKNASAPKSHSVVEVFHHIIGSDSIRHTRSVWHPLMTTPNDVVGLSPTSFFVTNDHYYREGFMRNVEDAYIDATWTNTIYVEFSEPGVEAAEKGDVRASVALDGMHNNNGLGHGKTAQDVLITSCCSGRLHLGTASHEADGRGRIEIVDSVDLDSAVDNPSYFSDPYANDTFDASGFVAPGLSRVIDLSGNIRDPETKLGVMVWKVTPRGGQGHGGGAETWSKHLLFEDDGSRIRTASAAVLVALDPSEDGRRRARLFVTGFLSKSVAVVTVDL